MKTNERILVILAAMIIIVGFTASGATAAGRLVSDMNLYKPPLAVGTANRDLAVPQGNKVHQVVKSAEGKYEIQTISLIDPGVPYLSGKAELTMNFVQQVLLYRNRLYILGGYNASHFIQVVHVGDVVPKLGGVVSALTDAKSMAICRGWLGVIGDDKLQLFNLDKPDKPKLKETYREAQGGFTDIEMKGLRAYVLIHVPGQQSRITVYAISEYREVEKLVSAPVGPFVSNLALLDEFNNGFLLAMGTEEPKLYETYLSSRPKLEVKAYFEAFAIDNDGRLRPINPPTTSNKEMVVAVASSEDSGSLYLAVQEWFWSQQQGTYACRPIIKKFDVSSGGFRPSGSAGTGVTYPVFMQQLGDGLYVYGPDFDGVQRLEVFQIR